jgi:ABC-type multidrug transport system permease subunit
VGHILTSIAAASIRVRFSANVNSIPRSNILQRFEALFTNEFRTIRGKCSSLVPQGQGYENVSIENQVCTVVGSQPGQLYVDGSLFAGLSHEYYWSHAWRVSIITEIT